MTRLLVLIVLVGCGDNELPATTEVVSMPGVPTPQLDVLIQMDDSPSVDHLQVALGMWFDSLLDPLVAAAGATDLHVGLITSDYGTSGGPPLGQLGNGGCAGAGRDGALQTSGAPIVDRFLVDAPGAQNFTGTRHAVLSQIFRVGSGGCGFEQPLAALERSFANPLNAGFVRDRANLLVIAMQDEDDCSFHDPALLSPASPAFGDVQSFRCTRFGITCDEPMTDIGIKHHCHSNEQSAYLDPVAPFAASLASRKLDPSRVTFAVIAGPPEPVDVELRQPPGAGTGIPALAHSCDWTIQAGDQTVADPAVRMRDVVVAMEPHGVLTSVCSTDLRPSLAAIARVAKQMFGVACLDTSVLRDSDTAPGIRPTCYATEVRDGVEGPLAFTLDVDPTACPDGDHLRFVPQFTTPPTERTYVRARCEVP